MKRPFRGPESLSANPRRVAPVALHATRAAAAPAAAVAASLALAGPVLAHGAMPEVPPSFGNLVTTWTFEPLLVLPLVSAALVWVRTVRAVNRAHPVNPVPRARTAAFLGGLCAIAVALMSGIERYDTVLFSVHMVQHILLMLIAAPLIALGAPITLLLRASSPATRRRWILPMLHSRVVRAISFPVVPWLLFAGVLWATHFSPIFDLALEDRLVHDLEHGLYLGAALLFWWPAVGLDPSPWRMSHPVRAIYVFLQMPQNTFLAVALLMAPAPLYEHYVTLERQWGPTPLLDQQTAAGIMWVGGDVIFLAAVFGLIYGWMRHEERETARSDRRADAAMARIREREVELAGQQREGPNGAGLDGGNQPEPAPGSGAARYSR